MALVEEILTWFLGKVFGIYISRQWSMAAWITLNANLDPSWWPKPMNITPVALTIFTTMKKTFSMVFFTQGVPQRWILRHLWPLNPTCKTQITQLKKVGSLSYFLTLIGLLVFLFSFASLVSLFPVLKFDLWKRPIENVHHQIEIWIHRNWVNCHSFLF